MPVKRNAFQITFSDGNTVNTEFNGTLAEATLYYIGQPFNFGDTDEHPADKIEYGVSVTLLEELKGEL